MSRKDSLRVRKRGHHLIVCDANMWSHRPLGWNPAWKMVCMLVREGPRKGEVWKMKPTIDQKEDKDPEEWSCINLLTISLLHSSSHGGGRGRGHPHPFSLCVHLCLASILTKQTVFLQSILLVVVLCL